MPWSMPAIVLILVSAAHAPANSLAGAAFNESLRRLLMPPTTWRVNTIDIPPAWPSPPGAEPPASDVKVAAEAEAKAEAKEPGDADLGDENTWRLKMSTARAALDEDQILAEAMQSRINALVTDFASRDDPAQRAEIERQRIRALDELDRLKKQIDKDKATIAAIEEDARKKGIPPGWIRLVQDVHQAESAG